LSFYSNPVISSIKLCCSEEWMEVFPLTLILTEYTSILIHPEADLMS